MTSVGNPIKLDNKRLVVIGGTTGIGLSAAKAFVAAGAYVVAVGLDEETALVAADGLGKAARVLCLDARMPETAPKAIEACRMVFGQFDGLYHVAGGSGRRWGDGPLHEITDEGWQATLELNLSSVFYSNRAAVRSFLAQNTSGSILNLASVLAWAPSPHFFATHSYTAAKSAILGMIRSCAAYYAPRSIRFNALAPGLVETPMAQRAAQNPNIMQFIKTKQPMDGGRIGQPQDLDAAAVYFLSEASAFVTGQVLAVDGGWGLSEGQIPTGS
jgi:NAD(P)-dependent dehydrogenase (short-subunit alcohol dehydrogenase family)